VANSCFSLGSAKSSTLVGDGSKQFELVAINAFEVFAVFKTS